MPVGLNQGCHARLGQCPADVHALHQMCRQGRLYEVEGWIADGKPIQIAPEDIPKRTRYRSALEIALESGQHSLTLLLLRGGYRLALEPYSPLDLAMQSRRWDLVDLLLEWGAPMRSVDVSILLDTYNIELYERFRTGGYDLTQSHGMGMSLDLTASNRHAGDEGIITIFGNHSSAGKPDGDPGVACPRHGGSSNSESFGSPSPNESGATRNASGATGRSHASRHATIGRHSTSRSGLGLCIGWRNRTESRACG